MGTRASKLERILRCSFNASTSLNESLVASMREMARLELQGGGMRRQHEFGPGRQTLNEKELQYAVAASVLRALPARLKMESHEWIADPGGVVPYLGAGTCAQLRQMVATGTCDQLDALRAGAEGGGVLTHVRSGKVRSAPADFDGGFGSISAGPPPTKTKHGQSEDGQSEDGLSGGMVTVNVASGAVVGKIDEAGAMRDLRRLPSIGEITAKALIEAGVKSVYELKLDHSSPRGVSRSILTEKQSRCVAISDDLLSEVTASEVEEMRARLLAAARSIRVFGDDDDKNSAWEVVNVGGGRRSDASHDADFIVSHPLLVRNSDMDGVLTRLIGAMGDSILREDTDFHMLSIGRLKEYWRGVKDTGKNKKGDPKHGFQGNNDCYDKLYGIYRTANGAHRRIDVVLVPRCMLPFALIGWTGSKQYNRFLRRFAIDERGLILTSHGLHRTRDRRTVGQTPDDGSLELGLAPSRRRRSAQTARTGGRRGGTRAADRVRAGRVRAVGGAVQGTVGTGLPLVRRAWVLLITVAPSTSVPREKKRTSPPCVRPPISSARQAAAPSVPLRIKALSAAEKGGRAPRAGPVRRVSTYARTRPLMQTTPVASSLARPVAHRPRATEVAAVAARGAKVKSSAPVRTTAARAKLRAGVTPMRSRSSIPASSAAPGSR